MLRMNALGIVLAALLVVGTQLGLPAFAQETLKPEERAAVILNSARKAFNDQQYVLANERFQEQNFAVPAPVRSKDEKHGNV